MYTNHLSFGSTRAVTALVIAVTMVFVFSGCSKDELNGSGGGGGSLDVNLWIVAIPDYGGTGDANLAVMVNEFIRLMNGAGISIGNLSYITLSGSDASRLTYINLDRDSNFDGIPDDMEELFRMSSQAGNDYLNLFFVMDLGDFGVLGIAGAIPGPVASGTSRSGVVINTFGGFSRMSSADLVMQGNTMAHEVGHYLGLYHTTEDNGVIFDPITDTPECNRMFFDINGDGIMSAFECQSQDGPNLMFWAAANYPQETVSSMQISVMSTHGLFN